MGAGGGGPARPVPVLYPDIASAGSLRNALHAEFDRASHLLSVLPEPAPGWRYVGARVEDTRRRTSVVMGIDERVFIMEFWTTGVCMARGSTADLPAVAGAAHTWQSGSAVRELSAAWPFVSFSPLAEAHERGEAAEYTWRRHHDDPQQAPHLHSFIAMAIHEPRLRALFPFTSMGTLGFSRTAGYPHSDDCPWIRPLGDDRYLVTGPDGRVLGTADAAGSVALALSALPAT